MTLYIGGGGIVAGGAHLQGVIANATTLGYAYDFRLASLLLVGILMVFVGVVCLTGVRAVVRVQRRGWERALIGTLLLLVLSIPLIPVQPDNAGWSAVIGAVNLIGLVAVRPRLEAG